MVHKTFCDFEDCNKELKDNYIEIYQNQLWTEIGENTLNPLHYCDWNCVQIAVVDFV